MAEQTPSSPLVEAPDLRLPLPGNAVTDLLGAVLAVAGELEQSAVLERFVQVAAALTGAEHGALNVVDEQGTSTSFVSSGVPSTVAQALGTAPHAQAVLGQIPLGGALRLDDLRSHPSLRGFRGEHLTTTPFLGTAVRIGPDLCGQLYLSGKPGGFTQADEEVVVALGAAAAAAVANAHLYADAERREHWLRAGQDITTMLLASFDEDEALERIVGTARDVGRADTAALALPWGDGELVVEVAVGSKSGKLLGALLPPGSRAWTVVTDRTGLISPSLAAARKVATPAFRAFGPALFAPVLTAGRTVGVIILLRKVGGRLFERSDLVTAQSFAAQAALAYQLAAGRQAQDLAALLDERERIARDLHDLAIQQLFATGMQLETIRRRASRGVDPNELLAVVDAALDNVDGSVRQIRQIVRDLRDPDGATGLVERLRREASLARTGLGFAPSFVVTLDGVPVSDGGLDEDRVNERVDQHLTSDVVAVVREGLANAARHAQATTVTVRVGVVGTRSHGCVEVVVEDDGVGIPSDVGRSSGTRNLAARAHQHGGTFAVGTRSDRAGTRLTWEAPLR